MSILYSQNPRGAIAKLINGCSGTTFINICKYFESLEIIEKTITNNRKTWFCRRGDDFDQTSYKTVPCMTIDELNKKNKYKEHNNPIDKIIHQSRYGTFPKDCNDFNKVRPLHHSGVTMYSVADSIMFNKTFNIENFNNVGHYLALCKYEHNEHDEKQDSYKIDGWSVNLFFSSGLPYTISFDSNNIGKFNFVQHDYQKREIVRCLLQIMNETPIDELNMNNYAMLAQYESQNDLFLQSNERQLTIHPVQNNGKTKSLTINGLLTKYELCGEIRSHIVIYPDDDLEIINNNIEYCFDMKMTSLDMNKLSKFYNIVDLPGLERRLKYLLENKHCVDFEITVNNFINELYTMSSQYGMGQLNEKKKLTDDDYENIKKSNYFVSYLNGVPLKTSFANFPIVDYKKYDEYHGDGSFMKKLDLIEQNQFNK